MIPPQDSSLASWLSDLEARLQPCSDTPRLDSQVLLSHILDKPRTWLLAHLEDQLSPDQVSRLERCAARLEAGEALPYVLGHWEFYGLDFQVTPDVLIPRPETELLVEYALDWLSAHNNSRRAIDVATGSGCIAITLAAKLPDLTMLATDISQPALDIAVSNAQKHAVMDRVQFIRADLLDFTIDQPFDLICANLPYIPTASLACLAVSRREPRLALDGGRDGLDLIRKLLVQSRDCITQTGLILLEIESSQGLGAKSFAQAVFPSAEVCVRSDLADHDRLLVVHQR